MDWLHKKSHRYESTGAEQGCWGRDIVDVTHRNAGGQTQWHQTQWLTDSMACETHTWSQHSLKKNKPASHKANTGHWVHSDVIIQLIWHLYTSLITMLKASLDNINSYFTVIFTSVHLYLHVWISCWEFGLGTSHVQHPSWATIFPSHSSSQMLKWT